MELVNLSIPERAFTDLDSRDYGATRGFANESEFTVVKVDFYNDIKRYLAELENTEIRSLEDIVKYISLEARNLFSCRYTPSLSSN